MSQSFLPDRRAILRENLVKNRGIVAGMTGFFAGIIVGQLAGWPTLPKAVLVGAVAAAVIAVLLLVLPKSTQSD